MELRHASYPVFELAEAVLGPVELSEGHDTGNDSGDAGPGSGGANTIDGPSDSTGEGGDSTGDRGDAEAHFATRCVR